MFPEAEHRFCVMHLYRNMWKDHKGIGVRMCLWLAARATTDYTYNKHMEELKKVHTCHYKLKLYIHFLSATLISFFSVVKEML